MIFYKRNTFKITRDVLKKFVYFYLFIRYNDFLNKLYRNNFKN